MTTTFSLDPTLPWLFSDPTMQEPAAFRNMQTVTLSDQPYEPMALYFPAGTQLAMRLVTSLDQLTEGAAYWHEWRYYEESQKQMVTRHSFGRYAGLSLPNSKSTPRNWKQGRAHIILESDVLDCDLKHYFLREDGTHSVFVDTTGNHCHKLYRITHYVSLSASTLGELGPAAIKQSGLTLRQATWLRQEQDLLREAVEITSQMTGGLKMPNCRVVMAEERARDFLSVQHSLPTITAGQATRCKSGTVAITYRTRRRAGGGDFVHTDYYKLLDAAPLLDWLDRHSSLQRLQLDAAISQQTMGHAAEIVRTKLAAERQAEEAQRTMQQAQEAEQLLHQRGGSPLPIRHEYAELAELALAA